MNDQDGSPAHAVSMGSRQPNETAVGRDARSLLLVVAVVTLATGIALLVWPSATGVGEVDQATQRPLGNQFWPWPLRTELNSRFFGAFFVSVGVGAALALREQSWERIRILFPVAIVFTALGLLAAQLHLASFNPARLTTWLFFAIYIVVLVAELAIYVRYEQRRHAVSMPRQATDV